MFAILHALGMFVADLFKSLYRLEAENLLLRHQLPSFCDGHHLVSDCLAVIARCSYGSRGFGLAFLVRCRWFSRRPSCVGIALVSKCSGVGNRVIGQGGRGLSQRQGDRTRLDRVTGRAGEGDKSQRTTSIFSSGTARPIR